MKKRVRHLESGHCALVGLFELITVHRVCQHISEVRIQIEIIVIAIGHDLGRAGRAAPMPFARQTVALAVATIGRIDETETIDVAALDGALGDLIGRIPIGFVAHESHRPAGLALFLAVAQHAVGLAVMVAALPWAVVVLALHRIEQSAFTERARGGIETAIEIEIAAFKRGEAGRQLVHVLNIGRAGTGEVTVLGVVHALLIVDGAHQLRDEKAGVRPTLTVRMGGEIDGHTVYLREKVGAVIEIEATQVILVGLPFTTMLTDDETGHRFQ